MGRGMGGQSGMGQKVRIGQDCLCRPGSVLYSHSRGKAKAKEADGRRQANSTFLHLPQ